MNARKIFDMLKCGLILILFPFNLIFGQTNLNYFINQAINNSPVINNYNNLGLINNLQKQLDEAQNSAFKVYLTGNYLFAPYFNNNGHLVTTNPSPEAIGYDVSITNGGQYSALLNVDKNIFNGGLLDALQRQRNIEGKTYKNKTEEEEHSLRKQVTDQYLNTYQSLELYNISKEILTNMKNQLNITGHLVTKGLAKVQDYMLLKVETRTQQINLNQIWQDYKNGLSQLYSLCGISDTGTVMLDSVSLTLSQRPGHSEFLTQYYLDSLNTAAQQKVFETKYLPQVDLFFNTGLNAVEIDHIQRRFGLSAGVNFSLPILDGGQKDITRQQSIISEKINNDFKNYAFRNIYIQRKNAENRINSLEKNLEEYGKQSGDYKKLLNISLDQLQQGNLSMIEYLTELRNYIDFEKNYISAQINYQLEISNYNYWNW
jgi:outer membrane protein TolC